MAAVTHHLSYGNYTSDRENHLNMEEAVQFTRPITLKQIFTDGERLVGVHTKRVPVTGPRVATHHLVADKLSQCNRPLVQALLTP